MKGFNKEQFINDCIKEFIRYNNLKKEAFYNGKSSKAKFSTNKLAKKYNLSNSGYGFLDTFVGYVIMKTMFAGYVTDEKILREAIEKSLKETENKLIEELKVS